MEVGDTLQFYNDAFFSGEDLEHLNGKTFTVTRLWRQRRDEMVDIEVEGTVYDSWTLEVLQAMAS